MNPWQSWSACTRIFKRAGPRRFGLVFVFLWFMISGVFELLGAAGLLYSPMRRAAGVGLFALTIAVTPAHIYMLQRPELFNVPYWALVIRLPVQVALLFLIAWSTQSNSRRYV